MSLVIGFMILGSGIYYLIKEKGDNEARKIYGIAAGVGVLIIIAVAVKLILEKL